MISVKESNQDKLIAFLQKQLQQQQTKEVYYEKQLADLKTHRDQPELPPRPRSAVRPKTNRLKPDEVSIMEQSALSINSHTTSKPDSREMKREPPQFEMEYQQLSKQITKLIHILSNKDSSIKKNSSITPKRKPSFSNKSGVKASPTVPEFNMNNLSVVSVIKTQRENVANEQRERVLLELGDITQLVSNDQVVTKLISNFRSEQEKYVDAVLFRSKMSARLKMKNYLQHLSQKNEQTLFKLKQNTLDRNLSRLQFNKETIRTGYTPLMKELIQRGLNRKAPAKQS